MVVRDDLWHSFGEVMWEALGPMCKEYGIDDRPYFYEEFINDPNAHLTNEEDFDLTNAVFCDMVNAAVARHKLFAAAKGGE